MVFEAVVTDVLNKILGDYVVNLDKKQLQIGIWGGDVVLTNLKLRENALDDLDLPVQLIYGFLGKLVLKIPWKNLYGEPVVAQVEDFYVLISPKQSVEYNAEKEAQNDLYAKKAMIQQLEEAKKLEANKDKPKPDQTFTERLTAQIVNNLQLKITNVHIRYEDTITTGKPFSFGITLHELELSTTNSNWEKCYMTKLEDQVFKISNLECLSAYMNCDAVLFANDMDKISDSFRDNIAQPNMLPKNYSFIIGPITSMAKLRLNLNPEYNDPPFVIPKIMLSLEMRKLQIGITSTQFQNVLKLADAMNRMKLGMPYRKYRPHNIPYKGHYREWWKFAITAILEEDIRKRHQQWSWDYIREYRQVCRTYTEALRECKLTPKPSLTLIETRNLCEQKLNTFNLMLIYNQVLIEVEKIRAQEEEKKEHEKKGWFGGWFGRGSKTSQDSGSSDFMRKFEAAMTDAEKAKLYHAIGYQENTIEQVIPPEFEAIRLNFALDALEIGVYDDMGVFSLVDQTTVMLLNLTAATCCIGQRPSAEAINVSVNVKEMKLTGLEKGEQPPLIIKSQVEDELPLLALSFETNPIDKKCDQRVKIVGRPLIITYDSDTILYLIKTFTMGNSVNLSEIEEAASEKMAQFKERSATGLQYIVDEHSLLDLDIKIMPSVVIIPTNGKYVENESSLIVVSLGELRIITEEVPEEETNVSRLHGTGYKQNEILQKMLLRSYDKFRISLGHAQVLIVKPKEDWQKVLNRGILCEMHMLEKTSIIITAQLCVISDDPRLPKIKVEICIPTVQLNLTEERVLEALGIVLSIPLPESTEPPEPTLKKSMSFLLASKQSISKLIDHDRQKKLKIPSTDDMADVIQYTDLEMTFQLKEFGVSVYKNMGYEREPSFDTSSDKFGTPDEEIDTNQYVQQYDKEDTETFMSALKKDDKILAFQVLQLEGYLAQRTYELVASAKLGAITLVQDDDIEFRHNMFSIIDIPQDEGGDVKSLLEVQYLMVDKHTPDFTTKYNSTEQLVVINFAKLNFILHQECLLKLIRMGAEFQTRLELLTKKKDDFPKDRMATADTHGILDKLTTIVEEKELESNPSTTKKDRSRPKRQVVESIKIRLRATLEQFSVKLSCRKRELALLKVKQFFTGVIIKSSYTEVTTRLKDIDIIDMNPYTIHSNILSIVGEDALKSQVVLYNLEETSNYNSDQMKLDVSIGCVKIMFLNWFISTVLSFLSNFQAAQEAIFVAAADAADVAKQNAIDAYEDATRMKINIKIKAPVIIVPINSYSTDGISIDLGSMIISNVTSEIKVLGDERSPAVLEELRLEMRDMEISKVKIVPASSKSTGSSSESEVVASEDSIRLSYTDSFTYGLKERVSLLDPMSFTLVVKRNLSSSWYKEAPEIDVSGHLKSIELSLFNDDYALLMSILSKNLTEGQNEFETDKPPPQPKKPVVNTVAEVHHKDREVTTPRRKPSDKKQTEKKSEPDNTRTHVQFRFNFQFDGIVAKLFEGPNKGLALFGIHFLSVKGKILDNGTLSTSIVLCQIQIDDIRENVKSKITKYLCRKDWKSGDRPSRLETPEPKMDKNYMLDLTAIVKENDTFAEVRVCGFDLIITIDFLMRLAEFFSVSSIETPDDEDKEIIAKLTSGKQMQKPPPKKTVGTPEKTAPGVQKKLNLLLYVEEPDIILVESLEDINTNAIIFNAQVKLNYRAIGTKEIMSGQIDGLRMYMCSFVHERREATKHFILHPCVISLQGSTPDEEGLHISINVTDIILNISPATIELINKALSTIAAPTEKVAARTKVVDNTEIWAISRYWESQYWFLSEPGYEALEFAGIVDNMAQQKVEQCILEVPSITIVVETGIGYYTTPMLDIEMKLDSTVANWSRDMQIDGILTIYMNYYNHSLGVWEPLIEQLEKFDKSGMTVYEPWQLRFGLGIQHHQSDVDLAIEEPTTKITIESEESLEVTLSKTCLDTLTILGEAFSSAMDSKRLTKPDVIAAYFVENDTGFDIALNFRRGIFTLHECHMPNVSKRTDQLNSSLVFQSKTNGQVLSPDEVKDCTISPGGRAYLQTKDLSKITDPADEAYEIYVSVGGIDKEVVLPVSKSVQRYFPLYRDINQDPWGIISQVTTDYGTTKINIHGVVSIENHFTTNVRVYRKKQGTDEKILVGDVASGEVFHVPLHAIYADSKELFFALNGYSVSVQGIRWNDCPTDFNYQRQIQCDPIDTFEPLYINAVRLKTEVFHENTTKFMLLSAYYTIHLRPPLYLRNALPIEIKVSVAGCTVRQIDTSTGVEVNEDEDEDVTDHFKSLIKEDLLDYGEKEVKPGDVLHLPTVQLTGRRKETKSYVVVRLIQYLEKDWSCTTEISEDHKEYDTWTFNSYDSATRVEMDLGVQYQDRFGSLVFTVYSPFWMINKTGLMLSYKTNIESVDVLYHPPEYNGPILFSFRDKFLFDKKRASIRVDNGEWSEKFPLDVAGSTGEVVCNANEQHYHFGVHNHLTNNSLTKQITFIPFYMATNKCEFPIEIQERSRPADPWILIEPNECIPFWPKTELKSVVLRVDGRLTVPFNYTEIQCSLLKLDNNQHGGINVDVQATEGGIYITFTNYNAGDAPGLLINHTSQDITFQEKGSNNVGILSPSQKVLFTWTDPAGERILQFGKENLDNDLRQDGGGKVTLEGDIKCFWVSFLDGLQRVLLFTEIGSIAERVIGSCDMQKVTQEIEISIHGIGLSILNNVTGVDVLYLGIKSSGIIWEHKKPSKKRFKQFNIAQSLHLEQEYQSYLIAKQVNEPRKHFLDQKYEIDFDNMVYRKATERIIRRTFYPGLWFDLKTSPFQSQLHAKINRIQIDNQLTDCIFPVVLAPIPPPKSIVATTTLKPFVECSVVERVVPNSTIKQFKYCSMLIQEFHFKVDIIFLSAIADLFSTDVTDQQAAKLFNDDVDSITKPLSALVEIHSAQEQKNFYDNLHLGPLKIHVSFSMAGSDTTALPGLLSTIVQGVGVTLTDVNDVVFKLAFFERQFGFFTQKQLTSEITAHYTGQAVKQLYVLVLGLDVIGNPYGLVVGLKTGVQDLFYEPIQGAIQGPGEFAEGLVLGMKSLFGHTVGGAAGAVSKITGAMGKGLAVLTFDEDYQKKRRQALNKQPANFQEGIARSGKGLVMGVVDGVSGVFTKPISGAKEEGVEGFFKGLGKGAIGLVARPTAGVVDFASGSFEAVRRATETGTDIRRMRPPRFMHLDNVLRPYSLMEAKGNKLLKEIDKGKYASTDSFAHCEEVIAKQELVLVSNHRVIYVIKNDLFGTWAIQWTYLFTEIGSIISTDRGIEILLKKESKKVFGLFSSSEAQRKIILIPQRARRDYVANLMESLRTGT